jgi:hypothetical protein
LIAGVTAVVATVVYLAEIGKEDTDRPNQPPVKLNAPRLSFYYFDESGEEKPFPVMRTGELPTSPAQSVYIEPNGLNSASHVSSVRFYVREERSAYADPSTTVTPLTDYKVIPYDSRDNLLYREVIKGTDDKGNYIEVQKNDGCLDIDDYYGRQTKLVVTVYDGSQSGKIPYPCFYANGMEFTNAADFTINFFDYVNDSEKAEVVIPPREIVKISSTIMRGYKWYDFVVFTDSISLMDSIALTVLR